MRFGRGGRTESFAPTKRRIPTPVCTPRALASRRALARNDRERDVGNAAPYTLRHCEEYPKGTCFAARSDAAIRSPRHKETDFRAGDMGGQSRSTLRRFVHWQFTFHIGRYSVSIRVMNLKSRNRNSAK